MKVTVSFGETRVIVPCGDGDLKVFELINRATSRFLKATKKDYSDVIVHCLQTKDDLAILDVDDFVSDICDDKDMLIAVYDEVSGSKQTTIVGVDNNNITTASTTVHSITIQDDDAVVAATLSDNDSGVAGDSYGLSNPPSTHTSLTFSSKPPRGMQRKNPQIKNTSLRSSVSSNSPVSSPELSKRTLQPTFSRDVNRKSLSSNHPMLYSWIDQHDKYNTPGFVEDKDVKDYAEIEEIQLDQTALQSVTIKPYTTATGVEIGLIVHDVVEHSYVDRVGELQTADQITEINGISLQGCTNETAKRIFDEASVSEYVKVKRKRSKMFLKDFLNLDCNNTLVKQTEEAIKRSKEAPKIITSFPMSEPKESAIEAPTIDEQDPLQVSDNKICFHVNLRKGKDGLGFSITSKDVLTSSTRAFFVKTVLNKGAAVLDGRIKAGDELITVNNVPVYDKSQAEVVALLRGIEGMAILQLARTKTNLDDNLSQPDQTVEVPSSQSQSYQAKEILTLTIPLTSQGSAGLGISVKGKRGGQNEEDEGIYVKSVIKGGSAAKDGRILPNDQLICINDTSLVGLSNNDAMTVLRMTLEDSAVSGAIRIVIGRSQTPAEMRSFSPYSSGRKSNVSSTGGPFQGPSPALHGGSMVPTEHISNSTAGLFDQDADQTFDERYLQKGKQNNIVRNKSYFRAISPSSSGKNDNTHSTPGQESSSVRTVSISSGELPAMQKSKAVFYQSNELRNDLEEREGLVERSEKPPLPSYEEALQRRDTSSPERPERKLSRKNTSSSTGSTRSGSKKYNILPNKMLNPTQQKETIENDKIDTGRSFSESLDSTLGDNSTSVASLDSVAVAPKQIPFQRDAFGRSSMSERKGRAHIDATKSEFYNKLKKFKSMEELRATRIADDEKILINNDFGYDKRSESIDTIISRIDEEERRKSTGFIRSSRHNASSPPRNALQNNVPQAVIRTERAVPVKFRSDKRIKSRPYSCVLEDARTRNSLLNDSFKTPVDSSAHQKNEKKKKGLFKGFATLLKKKKDKEDRSYSPEYLDSPTLSVSDPSIHNLEPPPSKPPSKSRPMSVHISNLSAFNMKEAQRLNLIQPDKRQQELVLEKINEMEQRKKRKHNNTSSRNFHTKDTSLKSNVNGTETPPSHTSLSPQHTWNLHDAAKIREKTKQIFDKNLHDSNGNRASTRSSQLQRQSSLPPRTKKGSIHSDIHIDSELSLEISPRNAQVYSSARASNSAPTSKPGTPVKTIIKSGFESLPRRNHLKSKEHKKSNESERNVSNKEGKIIESRHRVHGTQMYSSISDLTRHGGSVSISHQAQV